MVNGSTKGPPQPCQAYREEAEGVSLFAEDLSTLAFSRTGKPPFTKKIRAQNSFFSGGKCDADSCLTIDGILPPLQPSGAAMPLLGLPRSRVVLEHYAGWPAQEWMLELDETHALRVAAPSGFQRQDDVRAIQRNRVA